eukprot:197706-Amphidinium_carterae.2
MQAYSYEVACRMFHKPLAKADPSWDIDAALIKTFSSGDAGGLVKQKWLKRVIAASGIDDAIKESTAMMAREAFKYSLPNVKGEGLEQNVAEINSRQRSARPPGKVSCRPHVP